MASWQATMSISGEKTVWAQEMLSVSCRCPNKRQRQRRDGLSEDRDQGFVSIAAFDLFIVYMGGDVHESKHICSSHMEPVRAVRSYYVGLRG